MAPGSTDPKREAALAALNRAVFMRESHQASRAYEELIAAQPDFYLSGPLQYDLARLLELGNEPRLALHAYEQIISNIPDHASYKPSLRSAGHLAYRLKQHKKCRMYLEQFLESDPITPEKRDAEEILMRLPDGRGVPRRKSSSTETPAAGKADGGISLGPPETDEAPLQLNLDAGPISFGEVEKPDFPGDKPARASSPARQAPAPPPIRSLVEDDFVSAPAEKPKQGRSPKREAPELPSGFFDVSSVTSEKSSLDPYGDTPPLSILSRDVGKKAGGSSTTQKMIAVDEKKPSGPPTPSPRKEEPPPAPRPDLVSTEEWELPPEDAEPETPEKRYYRLRNAQFALLLPLRKKIHLDEVASIIEAIEHISEAEAKKAVIDRKGLLMDHLTIEDVLDIHPRLRERKQRLMFVAIERALRPYERYDVLGMDLLEPGLKMTTSRGTKKARWEDIRLISCGRLDRQPTIDLFAGRPCKHYRLREGIFNFRTVTADAKSTLESVHALLETLRQRTPNAIRAHTVENYLSGAAYKPQKFATDDEFDKYNLWMLFAHFGETVNVSELTDQAKATSDW